MRFSERTGWDRGASELAVAVAAARRAGLALLDLTGSNPTAAGLALESVLEVDGEVGGESLGYDPDPLGMRSAREAVCGYYAGHGAAVEPGQVVLTASTSEAYSHLFRLLCDPGDEVLIAQPSYPLFEYLAELADVRLRRYPLFFDHGWWMDTAELAAQIGPRTRALVVVHPNNPTGHATTAEERETLRGICARHGLALIVDEVFLDYPLALGGRLTSFAAEEAPVLTAVLSGLSKVCALPGVKVGWIAVLGPEAVRQEAMARLEIVADTFLSVNTPAQMRVAGWLERAPAVQGVILERVRENVGIFTECGVELLPVEAGWSAVARLPRTFAARDAATALLERGVLTHPGAFFGMVEAGRVVVSLLTRPEVVRAAAGRMREMGWLDEGV